MNVRQGLNFGRVCYSHLFTFSRQRFSGAHCQKLYSSTLINRQLPRTNRHRWRESWRKRPVLGLTALAALGPASLLKSSEEETSKHGEELTVEQRMLKASQSEKRHVVSPERAWIIQLLQRIRHYFRQIVLEPLATGFRFLHLVIIFVPVIAATPTIWIGRRVKDKDDERTGALWWYGLLVSSMETAGAAFIKLGQWAASRSDIFPPELCRVLSSLHSNAPAHSFEVTKETISRAFNGLPFEEIFEEFDRKPLGVGAIAQVYKAKLSPGLVDVHESDDNDLGLGSRMKRNVDLFMKNNRPAAPSSYVAVKVLHPGVERIVERDLRIIGFFAAALNLLPTMEWLSFPDEVKQFGEMMRLQLDLRIEASNLSIFRKNFKERRSAWFPYPYNQYTTREVLVEEFAQGIPLGLFLENGGGVYQKEIAHEGLDAFLNMLLIDNFIHSDLHPGNIMVRFYKPRHMELFMKPQDKRQKKEMDTLEAETTSVLSRLVPLQHDPERWGEALEKILEEGYKPQIIFIDAGLTTELNSLNRRNFLDLFRAIAEFDGYRAGTLMVERCRQPDAVIDSEVFALKMQNLILNVKKRTFALGYVTIGDVLSQVLSMVRTHHVRLEGDFVNVVISCLLLEGIGRRLDPELDLFKSALPILRRLGSGTTMLESVRQGDTSMLRVWLGIEARAFVQASVESVERCVKYDLLSPNI